MSKKNNMKKVFISYSWSSDEHYAWVRLLAERLDNYSTHVILDQWDLNVGDDKYHFMEQMVKSNEVDKVLIICDKKYKEKADSRDGGVGIEAQIITSELYNNIKQDKFIPIIAETGEAFDSYMPSYIKNRIAIDLSCEDTFEEEFEKLQRVIHNKPLYKRPPKGKAPSFLLADDNVYFKTTNIIKQLKNSLINKPNQVEYFMNDFIQAFLNDLKQFKICKEDLEKENVIADELVYNNIQLMTPLRNNYINFLELLCKLKEEFDEDIIINLFEELYILTECVGSGVINEAQFDHYKFIINELFIYTTAILIENSQFNKLNTLLSTKYFMKSHFNNSDVKGKFYSAFCFYIPTLDDDRNKRLGNKRISIVADNIINRSSVNGKKYKDSIIDADLMLYYISIIKYQNQVCSEWFPHTYIYKRGVIDCFRRITRKKYFEKIKVLFNIETKEDMRKVVDQYSKPTRGYNVPFHMIPSLKSFIDIENIGKY